MGATLSLPRRTGRRTVAACAALVLLVAPLGCSPYGPPQASAPLTPPTFDAASFPPLAPPRHIEQGIVVHETILDGKKIWIYLPDRKAEEGSLPCVLIAPAGTALINGMDEADGDRPEHLPYARAGMAVVAYSISGPVGIEAIKAAVTRGAPDPQVIDGAQAFIHAQAGFTDAEQALAFALARVPAVDANRIYTAGHSSAATLSLLVAENEPRLAACVAYAPCTDVRRRLTANRLMRLMEPQLPGFGAFIDQTSPINGASRLRCPLFVFHSSDDKTLPIAQTTSFVEEVKKVNSKVTFVQADHGGHYNSMIKEGVPQAIQWLKALPGADKGP